MLGVAAIAECGRDADHSGLGSVRSLSRIATSGSPRFPEGFHARRNHSYSAQVARVKVEVSILPLSGREQMVGGWKQGFTPDKWDVWKIECIQLEKSV
ncbi:hypothetical protein QPK87_15730 [Kamptonema cortianum]|nr:hypothetical protein [Kamptonema cortianum]